MTAPVPNSTPDSTLQAHFTALENAILEKDWLGAQEALIPLLEAVPPAFAIRQAATMLYEQLPVFEKVRRYFPYPRQLLTALAAGKPMPEALDERDAVQGTNPIPVVFIDAVERLELAADTIKNPHVCATNCARAIGGAILVNRYQAVLSNQPREWLHVLKHQGHLHREMADDLARQNIDAQDRAALDYRNVIAAIQAELK